MSGERGKIVATQCHLKMGLASSRAYNSKDVVRSFVLNCRFGLGAGSEHACKVDHRQLP